MKNLIFELTSKFSVPAERLFHYHALPGAFERLVPPWENVCLVHKKGGIEAGAEAVIRMKLGLISFNWVAQHTEFIPGRSFTDEQKSGPFTYWKHEHIVTPKGGGEAELTDRISFKLPFGFFGRLTANTVKKKLLRTFRYRHWITGRDLAVLGMLNKVCLKVKLSGKADKLKKRVASFLSLAGYIHVENDEDWEIEISNTRVQLKMNESGFRSILHLGTILDPVEGELQKALRGFYFGIKLPLGKDSFFRGWTLADEVAYTIAFLLQVDEIPQEGVIRCGRFLDRFSLSDAIFRIRGITPWWRFGNSMLEGERENALPVLHNPLGKCHLDALLKPLIF